MFGFRVFRMVLIGAAVAAASTSVFAQTKVGIIDTQKALTETAEMKKAQAELEARFKPRMDQMQKLNADIQQINNQLTTMAGKLTAQAEQDLQVNMTKKQKDLQRLQQDVQDDVDRERADLLNKMGSQMQAVVEKLATAKGLDVVIDTTNAVWFKAALDISKEATVEYDKAHPVK